MSKIILIPIAQLNLDDIRKAFKQAKADAKKVKNEDVHKVPDSETS